MVSLHRYKMDNAQALGKCATLELYFNLYKSCQKVVFKYLLIRDFNCS